MARYEVEVDYTEFDADGKEHEHEDQVTVEAENEEDAQKKGVQEIEDMYDVESIVEVRVNGPY